MKITEHNSNDLVFTIYKLQFTFSWNDIYILAKKKDENKCNFSFEISEHVID